MYIPKHVWHDDVSDLVLPSLAKCCDLQVNCYIRLVFVKPTLSMRHFPALICVVTAVAVAQAAHLPMLRQSRHRSLPRDVGDLEDRGVVAINVASATAGRPPTVLVPSTTTVSSNSSVSTSAAPMAALPSGLPTNRVALAFGQASRSQTRSEDAMTTTIMPVPSAVSKDNGQDAQGWVDAHNSFRIQYGAKDVMWDHDLSVKASNNAKKCNQQHS